MSDATATHFPIPDRLNLLLVALVIVAAAGLIWLGGRLASPWAIGAVGVAFSYLMLTNYALVHEAAHDNLHSDPRLNRALGVLTGALFPVPFTGLRTTHRGHHLRNRTDHEMFDLYYPSDPLLLKRVQWYGILCGFFWPLVPLGSVLFAAWPPLLRLAPLRRARSSNRLLADVGPAELRAVRAELLVCAAVLWGLFLISGERWEVLATAYACFSFSWSTRQYVGHAFSPRHVVEGAFNLRHNRLMSLVLLRGEWDLNHHRRPDVPWLYLPQLSPTGEPRPAYWRHYWRQWRGLRPATEPAPERLADLPLGVDLGAR